MLFHLLGIPSLTSECDIRMKNTNKGIIKVEIQNLNNDMI